jgi:hypothetical protein
LKGLLTDRKYFVDIFAIHTTKGNYSFRFGSTQIKFNRTRPIPLSENRAAVGKLGTLGGLSLFSFKVPEKNPSGHFKLHITPCGAAMDVQIMRQKYRQMTKRSIYGPTILQMTDVKPGERYTVRVLDVDDHIRMAKVEVLVTTKNDFMILPRLPDNRTVAELPAMRTCDSTTIYWHSSPDMRRLRYALWDKMPDKELIQSLIFDCRYCVYVFKENKTEQYYNSIRSTMFCDLDGRDMTSHRDFDQMQCFMQPKGWVEHRVANILAPITDHFYF